MRIGFVTDVYKPYVSGVTHCVSLTRKYYEEHGHEVFVFAFGNPRKPTVEPNVILSPGLKVHGTSGFRVGAALTPKARRLLKTMDVVHVDNPFVSGMIAMQACKRWGIPIIFVNHTRVDLYAAYYAKFLPSILHDKPLNWYMRNYCRDAATVLAPTESMVEVLRDMGVDVPIEVVPNGVDTARFLAVPRGFAAADRIHQAQRAKLGYADEDVVFVYSGRLGPEKNLTLLVDAFARIADVVPRAKLLFVGGGPQRKKIQAAADEHGLRDRVRFTGMVKYETIPDWLAPCDVWISPSVTEVHPLTVIEAMATGLPIIGVASPGVSDTVDDGVTGLLADRPEAGALAEVMYAMAIDPERRHQMAVAAREAAKRYAIDSTGATMLGICEALVAESAPRRAAAEARRSPLAKRATAAGRQATDRIAEGAKRVAESGEAAQAKFTRGAKRVAASAKRQATRVTRRPQG